MTELAQPNISDFIEFVASKGDETIQHYNEKTCAIGLYWQSIGRDCNEVDETKSVYNGRFPIFSEMRNILPEIVFQKLMHRQPRKYSELHQMLVPDIDYPRLLNV